MVARMLINTTSYPDRPFQGLLLSLSQRPVQMLDAVFQKIVGVFQCSPIQDVGRAQNHFQMTLFQIPRLFDQIQVCDKYGPHPIRPDF
jgi:hypothetical protein